MDKFLKQKADEKLLDMIVKDFQPFSIVNDEGNLFFTYISVLSPCFMLT